MEGRLGAVPETERMELDHSAAAYPPPERMELDCCSFYRDFIRNVAAEFHGPISSGPDTSSYSTGASSYSGASYASNYSACSASADVGFRALRDQELKGIAHTMVAEGYIDKLVQDFESAPEDVLEEWFDVLHVGWVLKIRGQNGLLELPQHNSLQELVEIWTRALTVIIGSICQLILVKPSLEVERFTKAIFGRMDVFVDAILSKGHTPEEKLQAMLNIYFCVLQKISIIQNAHIFSESQVMKSLCEEVSRLKDGICTTMEKLRTLVEEDSSWTIDTQLVGSEVHPNTRFILDCIRLLRKAQQEMIWFWYHINLLNFGDQIDRTIKLLKDLLVKKSERISDPSLRYLFLLNNFYFVAQELELEKVPWDTWRLPAECGRYIDGYVDASWSHVLSGLSNTGPSWGWNKTSSLAKFESAFHITYSAHEFWKIPDPRVRNQVRKTITERVISGYRKYLEEHPELKKLLGRGSSTPEALEEMLGDLFEG